MAVVVGGLLAGLAGEFAGVYAAPRRSQLKRKLYRVERSKRAVQQRLRQVKKKQWAAEAKLRQAQERLEAARAKLRAAEARLQATRRKLKRIKAEIAATQARLEKHRKYMAIRLLQLYRMPAPTPLAVFVQATSFQDLVDQTRFAALIVQQDQEILARIVGYHRKLERQKELLRQREREEAEYKRQVEAQKRVVEEEARKTKAVLDDILQDRKKLEAALAALEAESKRIEAELARLQRSRGGLRYRGKWSGKLLRPCPGRITSGFGMRFHPILHRWRMHTGVDISAPYGTPIRAADNGLVVYAGWRGGYGKCVIIDHGSGIATLYAHMSTILVSRGQTVRRGQVIGRVGSTGLSTGPHLHFEVRKYGRPVNPLGF